MSIVRPIDFLRLSDCRQWNKVKRNLDDYAIFQRSWQFIQGYPFFENR